MSKLSPEVDRQVRIELLRARAAVERQALVHNVAGLTQSLSPSHLVKGLVPRLGAGNMPGLAWQAFNLVRRYPIITSTLSTAFLGGKRSRLLKLGTAAVVGWQVFRGWKARQAAGAAGSASVTNPAGPTSRPPYF
ncbi:hypothetical protein [Bordetella genomosp. 9]|uniref:hypothetical protein n=1 Tax=Bordetella genomosp. 9 TaxID=1416803 RepID=UPI00211AEB04|nr:hypothetical protein [Bordetella genomosp. 9]